MTHKAVERVFNVIFEVDDNEQAYNSTDDAITKFVSIFVWKIILSIRFVLIEFASRIL